LTRKPEESKGGRGRVRVYLSMEYPTVLTMARFMVLPRIILILGLRILRILLAARLVLHIGFF
jgi:hypothetical protein